MNDWQENGEVVRQGEKRYRCDCPCGKTFYATKSIFQSEFGMPECGRGSCPDCETFYNLTVDEENNRMILTKWDEYLEKRKKQQSEGENE